MRKEKARAHQLNSRILITVWLRKTIKIKRNKEENLLERRGSTPAFYDLTKYNVRPIFVFLTIVRSLGEAPLATSRRANQPTNSLASHA